MSDIIAPKATTAPRRKTVISLALAVAVLVGLAVDTTIIQIGSEHDSRQQAFSPDNFGEEHFPRIQAFIEGKAVEAATLGAAVLADKSAAAKEYGTASSTGAIMPVKLVGTAGDVKSGVYELKVEGVPADIRVRVQTGPAINGTDLRDAPGDIAFGSFRNQIEFQDAGSGINRAMKKAVLDPIDTTTLGGKTISVTGAFRLINAKNWLITPVRVGIQ